MFRRLIHILLIAVIGSMTLGVTSCKTAKMRDADEAYDRGEYNAAANIYRKLYNKYKNKEDRWRRGEIAFMMGQCYRHLSQAQRASAAFQNAIRYEYEDSMAIFYLAEALHHEGKWAEAIKRYNEFLELVPGHEPSLLGIRGCQLGPKWKEEGSRYQVKSAKLFNSRRADFCPMFLDKAADQLYFTSSTEKATGDTISEIIDKGGYF